MTDHVKKPATAGDEGPRAKNLKPQTFVRVEGPPGTPPNVPVAVDGAPEFLQTGRPGRVEVGEHRFGLKVSGHSYQRKRFCPAGHESPDQAFLVRVDIPAEAHASSMPVGMAVPTDSKTPVVRALAPNKASVFLTVKEGIAPGAQTVIYIHGIGNKSVPATLKCQWDTALFGSPLGDRSRMAYWVNREYYPVPIAATCSSPDTIDVDDDEVTTNAIMALAGRMPTGEQEARENEAIEREIDALAQQDQTRACWLRHVATRMQLAATVDEKSVRLEYEQHAEEASALRAKQLDGQGNYEELRELAEIDRDLHRYSTRVLPLPRFLRQLITNKITRAFLRDVNDFFFDANRRNVMMRSLADRINAGGGPFVIIAHSQGTMIAYEVLRRLSKQDCHVKLFVTIGSPLGLQEVQDMFRQWEPKGLRVPACVDRWVNVADRLDPVAFDGDISNDVTARDGVEVENERGWGLNKDSPRHPHSGTGYLRTGAVQNAVREAVGNAFGQTVGQMIVARDLADDLENSLPDLPHRTLIELAGESSSGTPQDLSETKRKIVAQIEEMACNRPKDMPTDPQIDKMRRYLSADLTRIEIEQLRTLFTDLNIRRVWRNAEKRALIYQSANTVQARTANIGYFATGKGIRWAVLDTGIAAGHPHFKEHSNIERQWDCTIPGDPYLVDPAKDGKHFARLDKNGHGTHVAGIIAGELKAERDGSPELFSGMAPLVKIYGFKVLDDQGNGRDSFIIKALDKIAELNETARQLVVHGLNLSLGGSFDPSVYGTGHTPICEELRRLWRQGVVVVIAAGNEGYAMLQGTHGEIPANLDISIGDPANLDEAIAVGSVHKNNPHTYGISYFSSRGPTADGRHKPDLVAPGEQVLSALHRFPEPSGDIRERLANQLYVEMSGTSMAAPHVSGILAAYLSVRREFIGNPDLVKQKLLENCTNLKRDPYLQGAGMPNLVKMLVNT